MRSFLSALVLGLAALSRAEDDTCVVVYNYVTVTVDDSATSSAALTEAASSVAAISSAAAVSTASVSTAAASVVVSSAVSSAATSAAAAVSSAATSAATAAAVSSAVSSVADDDTSACSVDYTVATSATATNAAATANVDTTSTYTSPSSSSQSTMATVVLSSSTATSVASASSSSATTSSAAAVSTSSAAVASSSTVSSSTASSSSASTTGTISGTSTFYGGNLAGGACMFTNYTLPSSMYGTAYSGEVWDNAAECGRCVYVTGPNGNSITAMIVDECPECDQGHLDLFQDAFAVLSDISAGTISTSYSFVECGITTPIVLHSKTGTSSYWFSMEVVNSNIGVTALEVSTDSGSTWTSTTRSDYNFFEYSSGFGTETVTVRITSVSGTTIEVDNVSCASDAETTATSNFS